MGQKTSPIGFRLGIIRGWNSRWFASGRTFSDMLKEDMLIKRYITRRLDNAGIANVCISRASKRVTVDIHTSRPGIVIGRKGAEVDKLREELHLLTKKDIMLNIVEVRKPELNAQLVADSIARQLEGRVSFRRAMKKALSATMRMGAVGIKLQCGGRLGGAEIARVEKYREGRVPLHTLRADIDYATSTARTTYGAIGVKVWVCRGEVLDKGKLYEEEEKRDEQPTGAPTGRPRRGGAGGPGRPDRRRRPRGRVRRGGVSQDAPPPKGRRPEATAPQQHTGSEAKRTSEAGSEKHAEKRPPKPSGDDAGTKE